MKRKHFIFITIFFMFVLVPYWLVAQEGENIPVAISPGSDTQSVIVWQSCPTFSWSSVKQAASYQIAIFELIDAKVTTYENLASTTSPVLIKDIPGPALSWTLSSEESLKPGSIYIWYVQALDSSGDTLDDWSSGRVFKVEQEIRFAGIEDKLTEKLREYGVNEEIITNVLNDVKSEVKEVVIRGTRATATSNISPDTPIVKGHELEIYTSYGLLAGNSNINGTDNTFIGYKSGYLNTSGGSNTFLGSRSGENNTTGSINTFIGNYTGFSNTTGNGNIFLGDEAGFSNTTGYGNIFIGLSAGRNNTEGSRNIFIGEGTGRANTSGERNTYFGYEAGISNTTGFENTFIGHESGWSNSSGYYNTFIGYNTGNYNTTGWNNTFLGNMSGWLNNEGVDNTFIGGDAGSGNRSGGGNVYIGYNAGSAATGSHNVFIGNHSGLFNTGAGNIFIGYDSGRYDNNSSNKLYISNSNTSYPLIYGEFDNTLLKVNGNLKVTGYLSLDNGITQINSSEINLLNGKTTIVTGSTDNDKLVTKGYVDENDDVGGGLTGSDMSDTYICKWDDANTRLVNSLISESNGALNINGKLGIGTSTPAYPVEVDTTGLNSCILVKRTDGAANYINATDAYANFGSTTNHPLRLVVNSSWKMRLNTDGSLDMSNGASCTTGGVWTNASSRSLKENIENLNIGEALDALIKLNPVKYNYKLDSSDKHVGFIAEDVPELVATKDRKGLSPMDITAVLTKVVQELKKENEEQKLINDEQKKIISDLKERITRLEKN